MYLVELSDEQDELATMVDRSLAGEDVLLRISDGLAVQLTPVELNELAPRPCSSRGK